MKTTIIYGTLALIISIAALAGCASPQSRAAPPASSNPPANNAQATPSAQATPAGTSSGPPGFRIQQVLVENNYDPLTNKLMSDHIEVTLQSLSDKEIGNMTAQYTITDRTSGQNESYTAQLRGFTLPARATQTIHFDNEKGPNHFAVNRYSIYYTSQNALDITVTLSADGYQAQSATVTKGAGGAEVAD